LAYPTPLMGMTFAVSRKTMNGVLRDGDEGVSVLDALKITQKTGRTPVSRRKSKALWKRAS